MDRRSILIGGALLPVTAAATPVGAAAPTVMVEQTFLKARPGTLADLQRYIVANWFAMDSAGVEKGIFTSYQLFKAIDANSDWDLVMVVGYPQLDGYNDPATQAAFKAIRTAHRELAIDGKTLKDLGEIVQHHRLQLIPG
jgi:hypothetical protein